jgi:amino acid transporter
VLLLPHVGLAKVFNISQHQAILLLTPIYFARMMATCFALGKLISAMAGSRLFPRFLSKKMGSDESPVTALSLVSLVGLSVAVIFLRMEPRRLLALAGSGTSLACMCGLFTYCIQLFGFVVMRVKLSRIESVFQSPFGIMGAMISFGAFLVGMGSDQLVPVSLRNVNSIVVISLVALSTAYYYLYARSVQTFSNAERDVLLLAHAEIKNANGDDVISPCMSIAVLTSLLLQNICTIGTGYWGALSDFSTKWVHCRGRRVHTYTRNLIQLQTRGNGVHVVDPKKFIQHR